MGSALDGDAVNIFLLIVALIGAFSTGFLAGVIAVITFAALSDADDAQPENEAGHDPRD